MQLHTCLLCYHGCLYLSLLSLAILLLFPSSPPLLNSVSSSNSFARLPPCCKYCLLGNITPIYTLLLTTVTLSPIHTTTYYYYPDSRNVCRARPVVPTFEYITPARSAASRTPPSTIDTPPSTPPTPTRSLSPPFTMPGRTAPASPLRVAFDREVQSCR